ncbi:UDP-N-acetylglucosamine--N-acetylmuramyl-(pentapeptide) pyrophosphoryl-undecaprenol N-acetylglucosamine transferase (EC [Olavius sp. associated proteobacterium Delta 1]|nr:UDP-N-acetylglucosamine--N-acetylmuramyl-(pentapeptide) pyrophosphoryl-undecaprenol N-acetylglucosamine transferase (EC [Olavius sp. associated proteobacterium Delta 1]
MFNNSTYGIYGSTLNAQRSKAGGILSALLSPVSFQLLAAVPNAPELSSAGYRFSGQPSNRPLRIVIAGGGTGGHLFPGIAIAQEFEARNSATKIIFVSTGNPMEKSVLSKTDYELRCITAAGIKGRGIWNQLVSVLKIPKGILESMRILKNFSPDLAVGLGSYSAGPVIMGAWLRRIPIVVHEQNILPGITNRILARFANRIFISFENTKSNLDSRKVQWTGNPVRNELLEYSDGQISQESNHTGHRLLTVLIIGGSQGAHAINMAIMEALDALKDKDHLHFIHQTGEADEQQANEAYRRNNIRCTVQSFFDNMAELYSRADLLICRAGATTVAEITALGKAAIFIPFPHAADNHQVLNAGSLSDEGAAEMIIEKDLSGEILGEKIAYYAAQRDALNDMAAKARQFGNPDAARNIVDNCYELVD